MSILELAARLQSNPNVAVGKFVVGVPIAGQLLKVIGISTWVLGSPLVKLSPNFPYGYDVEPDHP